MELEASELVEKQMEQRIKRKRRHSQCADQHADPHSDAGCSSSDGAPEQPAAKYRERDAIKQFRLTDFPDELLYEIFKNLDSWTYYTLMNCCSRFHTLLLDRRFWQEIELNQEPLPLGILEDVMERTHVGTSCIKLRGPSREHTSTEVHKFNKTLAETFATRSTKLSVLELCGVTIDMRNVRVSHFPATLRRLIFSDCDVRKPHDEQNIFSGINTHLLYLEEFGIEFSRWFEPYYIMILSKIPTLRWLSLRGCPRLGDFIPYGSMAARFGFKKLEYLDLRCTPITDSDLQCFNAVLTLKEILLECPLEKHNKEATKEAEMRSNEESYSVRDSEPSPSTSKASTSGTTRSEISTNLAGFSSEVNSLSDTTSSGNIGTERQQIEQPSSSSPQSGSTISPSSFLSTSLSSLSSSSSSASSSSPSPSPSPSVSPSRMNVDAPVDGVLPQLGGNVPSRSRFLPRPDQVIVLDFNNQRHTIRQVRPPHNLESHFDQMLQHPLFWNIINPLGRGPNQPNSVNIIVAEGQRRRSTPFFSSHLCRRQYPISDRGICCFGRPRYPVEPGIIWIRIGNRPGENSFERLTVRNYKKVTDISLQHLVQCSPQLVFIDLSGTSVTREGVQRFKAAKPNCKIVADHLIGPCEDDCTDASPTTN